MDEIVERIFAHVGLVEHFVEEILSVERRSKQSAMWNLQYLTNVIDHFQGGSRGQTENGHVRKLPFENREVLVICNDDV